jgi:hypothetical protein
VGTLNTTLAVPSIGLSSTNNMLITPMQRNINTSNHHGTVYLVFTPDKSVPLTQQIQIQIIKKW